jgi:prepilin-type N-terminal cleavage/methylation domain-containing protein
LKKLIVNLRIQPAFNGLTLIELIIVVAMIALVLTMAVSSYRTFSIKSKTAVSLYVAKSIQHSIVFTCQENAALTHLSNQTIGYEFKATEYIFNIEIGGICDAPTIMITTQATGAQLDPVLTITGVSTGYTGRITWLCVSDGLNSHVPEICRS